MFDTTHNLKNIFNNWISKKLFQLPPGHIGDNGLLADYNHVQELFALEETKALKVAHQLNATSISPDSIQRQSPRHALGELYARNSELICEYCKSFLSMLSCLHIILLDSSGVS